MRQNDIRKISEKLQAFRFAALKEKIDKDLIRSLRTIIRTVRMDANGILSCWCEDEIFIKKNESKPIPVFARFANKESGEFMVIEGHSQVAAVAPGKGALLHIIPSSAAFMER